MAHKIEVRIRDVPVLGNCMEMWGNMIHTPDLHLQKTRSIIYSIKFDDNQAIANSNWNESCNYCDCWYTSKAVAGLFYELIAFLHVASKFLTNVVRHL